MSETIRYQKEALFEVEGRTITVNEAKRMETSITGLYADLEGLNLSIGDRAPSVFAGSFYVENFNLKKDIGDQGVLTLSLVSADSPTSPYASTISVDFQEVARKLITHPKFKDPKVQGLIKRWEMTEESVRVDWETLDKFYYIERSMAPVTDLEMLKVEIANEEVRQYCKAVINGIESFNIYLPVIEKTTQYLKLPGVSADKETHEVKGLLNFENADEVGTYCEPPVMVNGYTDGLYFKSVDRIQQNANGSWSRTEQWIYTNDGRFDWIYKDGILKEIISSENQA